MTLSASEKYNTNLRELISETVSSYKSGLAKAKTPKLNPSKIFSSQYLLTMSRNLSLLEISALLDAERLREHGLSLARSGNIVNGWMLLDEARVVCLEAKLSEEALLAANTFQTAAEAYMEYKSNDYRKAHDSLITSIESCRVLNDEYGYNMELRRVHLTRNIVRVESMSNNLDEAIKLANSIVEYIESGQTFQPFYELPLWDKNNPLDMEEKWWCMDEILSEIALLLAKPNLSTEHLLKLGDPNLLGADLDGEFLKAHIWFTAMRASVENDLIAFFKNAIIFFSDGPGYLNQAWNKVLLHFIQICRDIAPETLVSLISEEIL